MHTQRCLSTVWFKVMQRLPMPQLCTLGRCSDGKTGEGDQTSWTFASLMFERI